MQGIRVWCSTELCPGTPTHWNILYPTIHFLMDELMFSSIENFQLNFYTDNSCISFGIDRYYNFELRSSVNISNRPSVIQVSHSRLTNANLSCLAIGKLYKIYRKYNLVPKRTIFIIRDNLTSTASFLFYHISNPSIKL